MLPFRSLRVPHNRSGGIVGVFLRTLHVSALSIGLHVLRTCALALLLLPGASWAKDYILEKAYWTDATASASFEQAQLASYTPYASKEFKSVQIRKPMSHGMCHATGQTQGAQQRKRSRCLDRPGREAKSRYPGQGGALVSGDQAPVRICESTLPRIEEEYSPARHAQELRAKIIGSGDLKKTALALHFLEPPTDSNSVVRENDRVTFHSSFCTVKINRTHADDWRTYKYNFLTWPIKFEGCWNDSPKQYATAFVFISRMNNP
jgi:hypothetical protein